MKDGTGKLSLENKATAKYVYQEIYGLLCNNCHQWTSHYVKADLLR